MSTSKFRRKIDICFYCGENAYYQFKNGKLCCEKNVSQCPKNKKINSEKNINNKNAKGYKHAKEAKQKMSKSQKGEKNNFYGKKRPDISKMLKMKNPMHNPEVIAKISGKNHHMNSETAQKISTALKGRKYPERTGKNHPNYGKHIHTKEFCEKQSKKNEGQSPQLKCPKLQRRFRNH